MTKQRSHRSSSWHFLFLIALNFIIMGCTSMKQGTYAERKSVNASVSNIIKAFDKVAIGLRGRSANGRELVSKYHSPGGDGYDYAATSSKRAFSRLRILGERRPYNLQIQYVIESRNSMGVYSAQSYDQEKAQKILKDLMEYLVTRPDREDFIDDFRPF
jgi:hypothetical protein